MMRLWIRQLVALSFLYVQAAKRTRLFSFLMTFLGILGGAYSVPAYGCGLVSGRVCIELQWSGIVVALVTTIANGISLAYDSPMLTIQYSNVAKELLKMSRTISLEVSKDPPNRDDADAFAERMVTKYDEVLEGVRLPWYVTGERHLASISLLENTPEEEQVEMTDADRRMLERIDYEMQRLA